MPQSFPFTEELHVFIDLTNKAFLTSEEEAQIRSLLKNEGLLRAAGDRLLKPTRSADSMRDQDAALDLLMAALKSGNTVVASEALRSVVQDHQVEDAKVDGPDREQLAGLKAEVLYQWSAEAPEMAPRLQEWLPGPVSQKIWDNVVRMQQYNLAESQTESHRFAH